MQRSPSVAVAHELWELPVFAAVPRDCRHRVRRMLELVDLPSGRRLYQRDRRTREVAVVVTGVAVTSPLQLTYGRGDVIGVAHALPDACLPWDVVAVSDVRLAVIERRRLLALLDEIPSIAGWIARALAADVLQRTAAGGTP